MMIINGYVCKKSIFIQTLPSLRYPKPSIYRCQLLIFDHRSTEELNRRQVSKTRFHLDLLKIAINGPGCGHWYWISKPVWENFSSPMCLQASFCVTMYYANIHTVCCGPEMKEQYGIVVSATIMLFEHGLKIPVSFWTHRRCRRFKELCKESRNLVEGKQSPWLAIVFLILEIIPLRICCW